MSAQTASTINPQYAFTRAIADHIFRNYDRVLRVDGGVGVKKTFDPCT